jgi:hypothetical protein
MYQPSLGQPGWWLVIVSINGYTTHLPTYPIYQVGGWVSNPIMDRLPNQQPGIISRLVVGYHTHSWIYHPISNHHSITRLEVGSWVIMGSSNHHSIIELEVGGWISYPFMAKAPNQQPATTDRVGGW